MNKKPTARRLIKWGILAAVLFAVVQYSPLRGIGRSTAHFLPSPADARVRYEPGAEAIAGIVAAALPAAIATVERGHHRAFARPVEIYICAGEKSLAAYGGPRSAGGYVFNGRLFLSNKAQNTPERLPRVLTHELSHLHLEQQLGMVRRGRQLPSWFMEGLAVEVSGGGGAETVSEAEARAAIAAGRTFTPTTSGSLLFPPSGRSYDLPEHLWYRQSALLVRFLRDKDAEKFRRLLLRLQDGGSFESSLAEIYAETLATLVAEFRAGTNATGATGSTLSPPR